MYPRHVNYFMHHFEQATQVPYGYLLVDLKPQTAAPWRLRPNAFKDQPQNDTPQLAPDLLRVQTCSSTSLSNMHPCEECGIVFQNGPDLTNHRKTWCPTRRGPPGLPERGIKRPCDEDNYVMPQKKAHTLESCNYCGQVFNNNHNLQRHLHDNQCPDDDDDGEPKELVQFNHGIQKKKQEADLEEQGIRHMFRRVRELNKEFLEEKQQQYEKKNMSQELIEDKKNKLIWRAFKEMYAYFVSYLYYMGNGPKTQDLLTHVEDKGNMYDDIFSKLYKYKSWMLNLMEDDESDTDSATSEEDKNE